MIDQKFGVCRHEAKGHTILATCAFLVSRSQGLPTVHILNWCMIAMWYTISNTINRYCGTIAQVERMCPTSATIMDIVSFASYCSSCWCNNFPPYVLGVVFRNSKGLMCLLVHTECQVPEVMRSSVQTLKIISCVAAKVITENYAWRKWSPKNCWREAIGSVCLKKLTATEKFEYKAKT